MTMSAKTECEATPMGDTEARAIDAPMKPREYFEVFTTLLSSPIKFFTAAAEEPGWKRAGTFLSISALFNAAVSAAFFGGSAVMGAVVLANNMFMPLLTSVLNFMVVGLFFSRSTRFSSVFSVYAYSTGLTLAISWIPGLSIVIEPLRAILVCIGLMKTCSLKWWQSLLSVCLSALLLLSVFWSIAPLLGR